MISRGVTGIASRRVVENESSDDLALEACKKALERSDFLAKDIDLIISATICKAFDPRGRVIRHEPSQALHLKNQLNLVNANFFDINNACAGMFTGIYIADQMIKAGVIKRALICSGESITNLSSTAQRYIDKKKHEELASLTVGDAGAAILLDATSCPNKGIKELELITSGFGSDYCHSYYPNDELGGYGMKTDSSRMMRRGFKAIPPIFKKIKRKLRSI